MDLKQRIVEANKAYRTGDAVMTDQEYDALLEEYKTKVGRSEYESFLNSLHESKGKVKHPFVMGSLNKLKAEEPDTVFEFLDKRVTKFLSVSAKVDGISCRLHYEGGKLVSASTRGDGSFGEDLTDKIRYVKGVPATVSNGHVLDIRGELVILKSDFARLTGFKNPRNACAGIMNRKDSWTKDDVGQVTFVAYTILGDYFTKFGQFKELERLGFTVAWNTTWDKPYRGKGPKEIVESLTEYVKRDFPYDVDGLVLSDGGYRNEDKYRPDNQVAFKINELAADTVLVDISWEGPSKDGRIAPVGIIEPVELGGATISRVTLNNLDYIEEKRLKYGSVVSILKSGDIIPKIVAVKGECKGAKPISYPDSCPCCGAKLFRDGPHLRCPNKDCVAKTRTEVESFIKKMEIQNVSFASLERFGIATFSDLLSWKPDQTKKAEVKFYGELKDRVFSADKRTLLTAMNFGGVGTTILNRIFDEFGFDRARAFTSVPSALPSGIGATMFAKYLEALPKCWDVVCKIANDPRYDPKAVPAAKTVKNGKSVCFTGSLATMGRSQASALAVAAGYDVKSSVCKGLTYLVTNDPNSGSSKNEKARKLGVQVIDETAFLALVKPDDNAVSVDDL